MFEQPALKIAVIYLRVSTEDQDERNQEIGVTDYAAFGGFTVRETIRETISSREALQKRAIWNVLDTMHPGETLLVSEVSRMARNTYEVFQVAAKASEKEIQIISTKNDLRLGGTIESKIMLFMYGIAAEIERSFIQSRTAEALRRAKASGIKLGRPVGSGGANKLDGRESEILRYLEKRVAKISIAKLLDVSRGTLETKLARMRATHAADLTIPLGLPVPDNSKGNRPHG